MLITNTAKLECFDSHHRVWQGIPSIAHTKKGRTFVSFYSGDTKETYGNYAVLIKSDNELDYSEPIAVAYQEGDFRCFDPVLWIDPLGRLWFIWNVMPGEAVMASICEDPDADVLTWSKEFYIGRGIMMNKPTVLSTGEWLFPIAIWKLDIYNNFRKKALTVDDVAGSYVYKTADHGKTFVRLGYADVPNRSFDEHMVYEINNGVLRMLVRLKNGIGESYSYNRGKHWSAGRTTELGGPSSRFFIKKLRSGRVLLINHHHFTNRNNLTAFLSEDDGMTFPYSLLLDERASVSYPDAIECDDGMIRIVYDRKRGCFKKSLEEAYASAREILTASITEEDVLKGSLTSPRGHLKRVVCKLGRLKEGLPDPYQYTAQDLSEFARTLIDTEGIDPIEEIFEKFPLDCTKDCSVDTKQIDRLIARFKDSENKDETALIGIIELLSRASAPKNEFPILGAVCEYIDAHLSEDLTVHRIAEHFHVSVYYLSHIFKAETGTTIVEYKNELRLTKSKLLLKTTDLNIAQISCRVGFESVSYFTETFTRFEKISPKKYRQLHQSK